MPKLRTWNWRQERNTATNCPVFLTKWSPSASPPRGPPASILLITRSSPLHTEACSALLIFIDSFNKYVWNTWHTPDPVPGVEYAVMSKTGVTPELLALRAQEQKELSFAESSVCNSVLNEQDLCPKQQNFYFHYSFRFWPLLHIIRFLISNGHIYIYIYFSQKWNLSMYAHLKPALVLTNIAWTYSASIHIDLLYYFQWWHDTLLYRCFIIF